MLILVIDNEKRQGDFSLSLAFINYFANLFKSPRPRKIATGRQLEAELPLSIKLRYQTKICLSLANRNEFRKNGIILLMYNHSVIIDFII